MSDDKKVIYSMMGVGKVYPPNRQVLKDIIFSYCYGPNSGVICTNGADKSTEHDIMYNVDDNL